MTFHQQRQDYEEAMLQKRLDAMTPEEIAAMQAEIEAAEQGKTSDRTYEKK
jgi:hypothetical protein